MDVTFIIKMFKFFDVKQWRRAGKLNLGIFTFIL